MADQRLEETSWGAIWGPGEGWLCHSKGVMMLPILSACCCGMTRSGECKFLLKAAMVDWESSSDPEMELTDFFDLKKIIVAILST